MANWHPGPRELPSDSEPESLSLVQRPRSWAQPAQRQRQENPEARSDHTMSQATGDLVFSLSPFGDRSHWVAPSWPGTVCVNQAGTEFRALPDCLPITRTKADPPYLVFEKYFLCMKVLLACMYVPHMCAGPAEASRGRCALWRSSYELHVLFLAAVISLPSLQRTDR